MAARRDAPRYDWSSCLGLPPKNDHKVRLARQCVRGLLCGMHKPQDAKQPPRTLRGGSHVMMPSVNEKTANIQFQPFIQGGGRRKGGGLKPPTFTRSLWAPSCWSSTQLQIPDLSIFVFIACFIFLRFFIIVFFMPPRKGRKKSRSPRRRLYFLFFIVVYFSCLFILLLLFCLQTICKQTGITNKQKIYMKKKTNRKNKQNSNK